MNVAAKGDREKQVTRVSVIGIVSNGLLGAVKFAVGIITHSVAIITDAVNNLTDTSSSIITIIGTHLAGRKPDAKHPFGYGRIEYLTSLVIGLIVAFTGVELCKTSIDSILHPKPVDFDVLAAVVLAVTVVVKIFLGQYTLRAGRKLDSGALVASGLDSRSDAVATAAALIAVLLYLWKHISIDAWVGAVISLYIVRTGYIVLKDTISKMIGEPASKDLAAEIHKRVREIPIVKGAYDLIINNYGPDFYVGSINIEVDHELTAAEICRAVHPVQLKISQDLRTLLVFGLYAVDVTSPETAKAAKALGVFCRENKYCRNFHGLFVDPTNHKIYCDITVEYGTDHKCAVETLNRYLAQELEGYTPAITVDTPFD